MKQHKFLILALALVIVAAAGAYWAFWSGWENDGQIFGSGTVEATEVAIAFRMAGILAMRPVDEGDTVKAGDLVAALDNREAKARLKEAEAAVLRARADLRNLANEAKRSRALFEGGAISQERRDRDVTASDVSRAKLAQAKAAADVARVTLEDTRVVSPIDGVVTRTHAEVGETVAAGRAVVTLTNLSRPWVRVYIPETQIGRVRLGDAAGITIDTFPDRAFKGRVTYVASEAEFTPKNVQTQEERVKLVFAIDVTADNPEGVLKPGMPADVTIQTELSDTARATQQP